MRRTPEPPTNPPEPKHSHGSHDIRMEEEPDVMEFDGPSQEQVEMVDGTIFTVVTEMHSCLREGCDASGGFDYLYTVESISERVRQVLDYARAEGEPIEEFAAVSATIVDWDDGPVLAFEVGDDTIGYVTPTEVDEFGRLSGECYGKTGRRSYR